jgi:hypothetical protein
VSAERGVSQRTAAECVGSNQSVLKIGRQTGDRSTRIDTGILAGLYGKEEKKEQEWNCISHLGMTDCIGIQLP